MAWYNANWLYRVKLTTLAAKVDADLTNYPVYVDLNNLPAGFHTHVNATDARDIRVTKSDGTTELAREVVFYNSTADTGELHFLADAVADASNTDFYIYYGNGTATEYAHTDPYGCHAVWASYLGVWHLNGNANDSGPNNYNLGTYNAPTAGTGIMGSAYTFAIASKTYFAIAGTSCAALETAGAQTWDSWFRPSTIGGTTNGYFAVKCNSTPSGWHGLANASDHKFSFQLNGLTPQQVSSGTLPAEVWYNVGGVYNGGTITTYVNGTAFGSATTGTPAASNGAFAIGRLGDYDGFYGDGMIDEVRIAGTARLATWKSTEYNNQSSPSTFYQVGAEEPSVSSSIKDVIGYGIVPTAR